jgi:hypothetical protein
MRKSSTLAPVFIGLAAWLATAAVAEAQTPHGFELTSVSAAAALVDGNSNVIHPGIVFFPTNWHGYQWWMAFTGYPPASREKPCIVASTNGYDWEVPPGLTNPIFNASSYPASFRAQALGALAPVAGSRAIPVLFTADTELTVLADGRLACYYSGFGRNGPNSGGDPTAAWSVLLRQTSFNGVDWSYPPEVVFWDEDWGTNAGNMHWANLAGPRVLHEPDGTLKLFRNDWNWFQHYGSNANYAVQTGDWTGTNWSAPALCHGLPTNGWHFDVWRGSYLYYMVGCHKNDAQGRQLWIAQSQDATNWVVLSTDAIAPPPMTGRFAFGDPLNVIERSTMYYTPKVIPRQERRVDLYASYLSMCPTNVGNASLNWGRILLFPDVTLPDPNNLHEVQPNSAGATPLTVIGTNKYNVPDLVVTNTRGSYASLGTALDGGYSGLQLFSCVFGHSYFFNALWGNSNQTVLNVPSGSGQIEFRARGNRMALLSAQGVLSLGQVRATNGLILRPTDAEPTPAQLGPNGAAIWNSNGAVYLYLSTDGKAISTKKLLAP